MLGPAGLAPTLFAHATKELLAQQWVRLGQAGHPDNEKLALSQVAIDLPAISPYDRRGERLFPAPSKPVNVAQHILAAGESTRRNIEHDVPKQRRARRWAGAS
jgi:hypothetical protein